MFYIKKGYKAELLRQISFYVTLKTPNCKRTVTKKATLFE